MKNSDKYNFEKKRALQKKVINIDSYPANLALSTQMAFVQCMSGKG